MTLDDWFLAKIESETKAIAQAEKAGVIATAAMHDYGRRVLAEARRAAQLELLTRQENNV